MGLFDVAKKGFLGLAPMIGARAFEGDDSESIARPEYFEDPDYREMQNFLKDFGKNILTGDIPEYYAPIGEIGGTELENVLQRTEASTTKGIMESLAKTGRARGGQVAASVAPALADTSATMRYNDYLRGLSGRQSLLGTGVGVTQGVRSAGERQGTLRNAFNWTDYEAQIGERDYQNEEDAQLGQLLGTVASVGLGAATGGMSFGLQGALAGGVDALTGGGTNFLGGLGKLGKTKKQTAYGG